jgi:hypothetical protein
MRQYIDVVAPKYQLPPDLVAAFVQVESGGDRFAWNPEPRYHYLWDVRLNRPFRQLTEAEIESEIPPADFHALVGDGDAELWGQKASWGFMQVMGAVAREGGFKGHFPGLCDPLEGLNAGCLHLSRQRARWFSEFGWAGVAAAYNAGSPRVVAPGRFENQVYVDRIAAAGGAPFLGAPHG